MKKKKDNKCLDCNKSIYCYADYCRSCSAKRNNKTVIDWPELNIIISMVEELGYAACGKKLNVSDNTVRKHLRRNKIDPKTIKKK